KALLTILVIIIGLSVISNITEFLSGVLQTRNLDQTRARCLTNILYWTMKILRLISVPPLLRVETTSFVATFGAATLAIGLALQGSLANFAGGVLILIFRPFQKGDYIEW